MIRCTFILVLKFVLPLHHLDISFVGCFEFLQFLVHLPELVRVLEETPIQFLVYLLLPSGLFLCFEFVNSRCHFLPDLFGCLLALHNLSLIVLLLVPQEGCQFLPEYQREYLLAWRLACDYALAWLSLAFT